MFQIGDRRMLMANFPGLIGGECPAMKKRISTLESDPNPLLPLLLVLFIGSGYSALIYEIVWSQLLELVIGASAISLGVLLGTFMGGMCLGSLVLPRVISARQHPLRVDA